MLVLLLLLWPLAWVLPPSGTRPHAAEAQAEAGAAAEPRARAALLPPLDFSLYLEGKHVYERNCVVCHGVRGDGNGELAATLRPKPRSFREGLFKFRSTPYGMLPTDADLRRTLRGGLSGTAMGMFTQLSEAEVEAVLTYVKSFSRRWRRAEHHAPPLALPPRPEWWAEEAARRAHAQQGGALFATHCASCHGAQADGTGAAAATLQDVWGVPAAPSDLRQPHPRSGDTAEDLYRTVATGLNGTPMVGFEGVLTPAQRWDVIAWLFSIRLPSGPVLGAPATPQAE